MTTTNNKVEKLLLACLATAYLFFCILYSSERSLYGDSAYYLFKIVNDEGFSLQHARLSGFIPQLLPLLGVKLSLSLKTISVLFSIGQALPPILAFVYCYHLLKQKAYAYLILVIACLLSFASFYWAISELLYVYYYSICLAGTYAYYLKLQERKWPVYLMGILILLLAFSHLLAGLLVAFIFLMFIYRRQQTKVLWLMPIGFFAALAIRYLLFPAAAYEYDKFRPLADKLGSSTLVAGLLMLLLASLGCILVFRFRAIVRSIRKEILYLVVLLSLFLLISLQVIKSYVALEYVETYYLMLASCVGLLLAERLKALLTKAAWQSTFLILCLLGVLKVALYPTPHHRVQWVEETIAFAKEADAPKVYLQDALCPNNPSQAEFAWAVPYESILISSINGESTIICIVEQGEPSPQAEPNLLLMANWEKNFDQNWLNPKYLQFPLRAYQDISDSYCGNN